jgi:hypothetical protein
MATVSGTKIWQVNAGKWHGIIEPYCLFVKSYQSYPASKVLSYFFSARHGEARETLCINSFEHALLGC